MHLYKQAPEAIVAVFPSDHFILEEDRFIEHVRFAARAVKADSKKLVLLAVEASEPETQYGYIVPRQDLNLGCRFGTQRVSSFVEKPDADLAFELVTAGGLWNTMTMVFKLKTLLDLVRRVLPGIYLSFCRIFDAIDTPAEQRTIDEVYRFLEPVNFSKAIMERLAEHFPDQVGVLPVRDVFWSDWGSQERIEQVKRKLQERYDGVAPTGDRLLAASG
jgi:mannose-1-phosphate guanylyltransferase